MADEKISKYERETITPNARSETSQTVVSKDRQGVSPGVVVALVLATVAVAIALAMFLSQRQDEQSTAAVAQPTPAAPNITVIPPAPTITVVPEIRTVPVPVAPPVAPTVMPTTRTDMPVNDSVLMDQVKRKILDTTELASATIEVNVNAGQVTLNGEVSNEAMRALAEQLAKQVKGVKTVINRIKVKVL